jgi:hypothetical protein
MFTTKTHPIVLKNVKKALHNGSVIQHPATPSNPLGQSGIHTFVSDVIAIVTSFEAPPEQWRAIHAYLDGKAAEEIVAEITQRRS